MKWTGILIALVCVMSPCFGRVRFMAVPMENIRLIDFPENDQIPIIRLPRQISPTKMQRVGQYMQGQPEAQGSSHFEQANFSPQEYVDYGAHTGHHGAFGWYADFPVHKDN